MRRKRERGKGGDGEFVHVTMNRPYRRTREKKKKKRASRFIVTVVDHRKKRKKKGKKKKPHLRIVKSACPPRHTCGREKKKKDRPVA